MNKVVENIKRISKRYKRYGQKLKERYYQILYGTFKCPKCGKESKDYQVIFDCICNHAEDGDPIIFLKSREMDDLLIIDEIIGNCTKFEICGETISKLIKLRDNAIKGDRIAIEIISKICDRDYDQDYR